MSTRLTATVAGAVALVVFSIIRPDAPSPGSDCEALSTWFLREPVAAVAALAIVAAGWIIAAARPVAGSAVLLAGAVSVTAHATAHPAARSLDGIAAVLAIAAVIGSLLHTQPALHRLLVGGVVGLVGLTVWYLTRTGAPLCDAVGPLGHGTWHLLIAASGVIAIGPGRREPRLPPTP